MAVKDPLGEHHSAAAWDLLLTGSAIGIGRRIVSDAAWPRVARDLMKRRGPVGDQVRTLGSELAAIVRGDSDRAPERADRRFTDPAWRTNPIFHRTMQAYLAIDDTVHTVLTETDLDWRDAEWTRFVVDNIMEGLSPSNNPLLNPTAWKALIDTGGGNAVRGVRRFLDDMSAEPRVPSMVDPDAFAVGETVALTPGAVVLRTEMFELIEYAPTTDRVYEVPLLIVPPVINKFYIMDITPGRSMIEHLVGQGQRVFTISWRNPTAAHRDWGFDRYGGAILEALGAVEAITGGSRTQLMSSCSGGIITAMAAAHLVAMDQAQRLAGLTLMVTVLDHSRAGLASAALDEATARLAIAASAKQGYLDGRKLAEVFAWLRPADLVWRYWVNNYLQGRDPAPFDVLFWNADTVRMPAALHREMITMGLHNTLTEPNGATMLGTTVDLSRMPFDTYIVAGVADHISPWQACYRSAQLLSGARRRFVLSTSGHIAALVNPPGNAKSSYRVGPLDAHTPAAWLEQAPKHEGSWWPDHTQWLAARGGARVAAPDALGTAEFPPLTPAPGSYVREE
ncbi:PHA/PHB synthase family protein [Nocardia stercoris]|uniref:Alpha/beta fold hydrolase n=1 Tax=Nocardia stercoris TaxID=2483361 RepID=A0A3M2KY12_9NOCA|nr:alpha/beta fold hydrolase [Nocardia stercoris]RMI30141.1 alpha/beta fold hydrolase [Nocardia stercoris]